MITRDTLVNVYNEYDGDMYGTSLINDYGYKFPRINKYGEAVATPVVFSYIQMMNNRSSMIREGALTFDEDMEEEIYKSLNIFPERDVNFFKKKDIIRIMLNPKDENIEKIIKITSKTTMERFKTMLTKIVNDNQYDVVSIMVDYINAREWEIKQGTRVSSLKVLKREIPIEFLENSKEEISEGGTENEEKSASKKGKTK